MKRYLYPLLALLAFAGIGATTYTIVDLTLSTSPGDGTVIELWDPAASPKSRKYLLTNLATVAQLALKQDAGSYQPASANLTNWSALATSAKQNADSDLDSLAAGITGIVKGAGNGNGYSAASSSDLQGGLGNVYQSTNANLTLWGALSPSSKQDSGNYITALTGDGTAAGPGSAALTLASIGAAGTYGNASYFPVITTDAKGRVTGVTTQAVAGAAITALTGDVTATGPGSAAATLASVGTAGTYGNSAYYPIITTDTKGRVTGVSTQAAPTVSFANPSATIGIAAVNGSASTAMRSDAAPALPTVLPAQKAFQAYQGSVTHAGTVTLDFDGSATVNSLSATGNLTLAFSNLATNRTYRLLIQQVQSTNITLTLPSGVHGYTTSTLSNGWHMLSMEAWGTVASNVWVSVSSDGTY